MSVDAEYVLEQVGFGFDGWHWVYSFKSKCLELKLEAVQGFNNCFVETFKVDGMFKSERTLGQIHIELPLQCESLEQGLAFLAYGLRSNRRALIRAGIGWFIQGDACRDLLPFIRERKDREVRYQRRPYCWVDRDWFRTARRKISQRTEDELSLPAFIEVEFDGRLLNFYGDRFHLSVPAEGNSWPVTAIVSGKLLPEFPKRFRGDPVTVDIWEDCLGIDRTRYRLLGTSGEDHGG